jgi:hypothetical protein
VYARKLDQLQLEEMDQIVADSSGTKYTSSAPFQVRSGGKTEGLCLVCAEPVSPSHPLVIHLEKGYVHPMCFKCERCNGMLQSRPYLSFGNSYFCTSCHKKVTKEEQTLFEAKLAKVAAAGAARMQQCATELEKQQVREEVALCMQQMKQDEIDRVKLSEEVKKVKEEELLRMLRETSKNKIQQDEFYSTESRSI